MDFHLIGGTNVFKKWYEQQHPMVRAAFEYVLKEVAVTESLDTCASFKPLTKSHLGICEIKFSADDGTGTGLRKFRVLGFWNYDKVDFVLVSGGRKPIPQEVFDGVMDKQLRYFRDGDGNLVEHRLV
jgi:hypothetical protein